MSRLPISLPDAMNDYVQTRVEDGQYGNTSEYFRDLVRRDQEQRQMAIQELRRLLDAAEASGIGDRSVPEILEAAPLEDRARGLLE